MTPIERLEAAEQAFAFYSWMLSLTYLQPPQSSLMAYIEQSAELVQAVLSSAAELASAARAAIETGETERAALGVRLTDLEARVAALEAA